MISRTYSDSKSDGEWPMYSWRVNITPQNYYANWIPARYRCPISGPPMGFAILLSWKGISCLLDAKTRPAALFFFFSLNQAKDRRFISCAAFHSTLFRSHSLYIHWSRSLLAILSTSLLTFVQPNIESRRNCSEHAKSPQARISRS